MSEEFYPAVEIDERDCIGTAEEEVAELREEILGMQRWRVNAEARIDEEIHEGHELQDQLDAKDKELEQAKEQIRKCHKRLAKWGEILGVIKFSMRDVDKADEA